MKKGIGPGKDQTDTKKRRTNGRNRVPYTWSRDSNKDSSDKGNAMRARDLACFISFSSDDVKDGLESNPFRSRV